ncbi:MAG: HAD-IA family hydrolase [Gammaproteobacteria bacterium]
MSIKALTLDLDGVLWNVWPTIARAEAHLHAWLEEHYPRVAEAHTPESLRAVNKDAAGLHPHLAHDVSALRKAGLTLAAEKAGYAEFRAEDAYEVFIEQRNIVELFEGVAELLAQLSERYPLVAVSNGNADVYKIGIGEFFHHALNPSHAGVRKPDPGIFNMAAEMLNVPLESMLHIGDEWETDMAGALGAGMAAVWYNPDGQEPPHTSDRLLVVDRLDAIPDAVETLAQALRAD